MKRPLTKHQLHEMMLLQRRLVYVGWHPAIAGKLVRRAAERVLAQMEAGMGKIQPTRRLKRELDPTIRPRVKIPGERCRRIQEIPGAETSLYRQLNELRDQGWNVSEVAPTTRDPGLRTFYACPPGVMPLEAQTKMLQAKPWGAPLYVDRRERF